eukprot:5547212-Prymnesium_polylepis.1
MRARLRLRPRARRLCRRLAHACAAAAARRRWPAQLVQEPLAKLARGHAEHAGVAHAIVREVVHGRLAQPPVDLYREHPPKQRRERHRVVAVAT